MKLQEVQQITDDVLAQHLARFQQRLKITCGRRFTLPRCQEYILNCYKLYLAARGKQYIQNHDTEINIAKVGRWLAGDHTHVGLYIGGRTGTGKTTLMQVIRTLINTSDVIDANNIDNYGKPDKATSYYLTSFELVNIKLSNEKEYQRLLQVPILLVDDIGIEPVETIAYGNVTSPLAYLLYYRYEQQMMTIFSSNLTIEELSSYYGERFSSRVKEMMYPVAFVVKNFREG